MSRLRVRDQRRLSLAVPALLVVWVGAVNSAVALEAGVPEGRTAFIESTTLRAGERLVLPLSFEATPGTYIPYLPQLRTELTLKIGDRLQRAEVIVDTGTPYELILSQQDTRLLNYDRRQRAPLSVVMKGQTTAPIKPEFTDVMRHLGAPMVGQAFWGRYCTTIDFQTNTLVLEPARTVGDLRKDPGTWAVPYVSPDKPWNIWIPVEMNGVKAKYHVDTGWAFPWCQTDLARQAGAVVMSGDWTDGWGRFSGVKFGEQEASPYFPCAVLRPLTPQHQRHGASLFGDLGLSFLRQFVVTIDMVNHVLYLKPWRKPRKENRSAVLGVQGRPAAEVLPGLKIEEVVPGSPADIAGMQPGDLLLRLDHVPMRDPFVLEMQLAAYHQAGDVVTVEFERAGTVRSVTVTLTGSKR